MSSGEDAEFREFWSEETVEWFLRQKKIFLIDFSHTLCFLPCCTFCILHTQPSTVSVTDLIFHATYLFFINVSSNMVKFIITVININTFLYI